MIKKYNTPAIYRWNIYRNVIDDNKCVYIGETCELCPNRVNGYLNPGKSQATNQRIKKELIEQIKKGNKVQLEIFNFSLLKMNNLIFAVNFLGNKDIRRFIETLLILYYKGNGYFVYNK